MGHFVKNRFVVVVFALAELVAMRPEDVVAGGVVAGLVSTVADVGSCSIDGSIRRFKPLLHFLIVELSITDSQVVQVYAFDLINAEDCVAPEEAVGVLLVVVFGFRFGNATPENDVRSPLSGRNIVGTPDDTAAEGLPLIPGRPPLAETHGAWRQLAAGVG